MVKLFTTIIIFSIIVLPSFATEFSLPEMVVQPDEELVIQVKIDQVKGMMAVSMEIEFDPEIISIKSVSKSGFVKNFMSAHNVPKPGKLLVAMSSGRGVSGEDVLVNIHIKVSDSANDGQICPLEFGEVFLNGENIETMQNGKLFVGHIISVITPDFSRGGKKAIVWGRLKREGGQVSG